MESKIKRVGFFALKTRVLEAGTRAMLVNDLRSDETQESNTFYALTDNVYEKNLLKFTYDEEN